jgi:hypothetical protein
LRRDWPRWYWRRWHSRGDLELDLDSGPIAWRGCSDLEARADPDMQRRTDRDASEEQLGRVSEHLFLGAAR